MNKKADTLFDKFDIGDMGYFPCLEDNNVYYGKLISKSGDSYSVEYKSKIYVIFYACFHEHKSSAVVNLYGQAEYAHKKQLEEIERNTN